jgi:hypothetical protein
MVVLIDPYEYNGPNDIFKNRSREQNYAFDLAFDNTCNQVSLSSLRLANCLHPYHEILN